MAKRCVRTRVLLMADVVEAGQLQAAYCMQIFIPCRARRLTYCVMLVVVVVVPRRGSPGSVDTGWLAIVVPSSDRAIARHTRNDVERKSLPWSERCFAVWKRGPRMG
jgi:hypothetical protein